MSNFAAGAEDDDSMFDDDLSPTTRLLMAESLATMGTGVLKFKEEEVKVGSMRNEEEMQNSSSGKLESPSSTSSSGLPSSSSSDKESENQV